MSESPRRTRWRDARRLSNGRAYRLAVWLGLVCSPSLHTATGACTFHRWHDGKGPA